MSKRQTNLSSREDTTQPLLYSIQIYVRKCTGLINYYKLDHLSLWFYVEYYAWLQFNILCPLVCMWICCPLLGMRKMIRWWFGFISMSEHRSLGYSHLLFTNWIMLGTRLEGDATVVPVLWVSSYTNDISDWDDLLWNKLIFFILSYSIEFEIRWDYLEHLSVWFFAEFLKFVLRHNLINARGHLNRLEKSDSMNIFGKFMQQHHQQQQQLHFQWKESVN